MTAAQLPDRLQAILADLALFEDRADRIQYLIAVADRFVEVPGEVATRPFGEEHRVQHCESEAFVWARERPDGTLDFHFAVENPQGVSARALAVVLGEALSGAPVEQVVGLSPEIVYALFGRELSMGKSMGLTGMVQLVQQLARERHPATAPA